MLDRFAAACQSLQSHLDGLGWGLDVQVVVVPIDFPGWSFFTVTRPPDLEMPELGTETHRFVVRDDGTVVNGPPEQELTMLFRSLELLRAPRAGTPEALARAVLMFAGRAASVVSGEEAAQWRARVPGAELAGPSLECTPDGTRLDFWAQVHAGTWKRPLTFLHVVVSADPAYRCQLSVTEHTVRFG